MRYILLVLLAVLLLAAAVLVLAIWHRWELHLHFRDKRLTVQLRGFGLRRTILDRDFSADEKEDTSEKPTRASTKKEEKENRFLARFKADKKRIYDPDKGGYQHGGAGEVITEYRELWEDAKETFRDIFDGLRYKIEVAKTEIRLDFGTGNPAHTGMAYSAVWGAVGIFYPLVCRHIKMDYPYMEVTPDFYQKRFDLEIKSIIKVRPAHIINALLKQGWRMAVTYLTNKFNKGSGKHE